MQRPLLVVVVAAVAAVAAVCVGAFVDYHADGLPATRPDAGSDAGTDAETAGASGIGWLCESVSSKWASGTGPAR